MNLHLSEYSKAGIFRYWLLPVALLALPISASAQPSLRDELSLERLPADFFTFEPEEYWLEPRDSYWMSFSNWVIGQEHAQSQRIQALGAWADRSLSGNPRAMPNNQSYLRIGFAAEARTGELASLEPEARFKLDLPTAEEKLRVVVESQSDELIPLGERRRDRQLTDDQRSDGTATGALRWLASLSDTVNLSNDIGARLRFPPDAFWRATAKGRWELDEDWRLVADQRVYYFHQEGWGASTWFGLSRELGNGWDFLASTEAVWEHDNREFELSHVLNFHKILNNRAELNPRLGILGESKPNWRTTSVFADLTWRYRLYHDWLYGEVIPGIEFPREDSFKDRTSLILRIEMFFSGEVRSR
ncbi:hypothetical protein SAMN05216203_1058 [Marinobacter daqiaonensis]|uniref:Uncharacterized protein n=1 Tax=Marinobacter daqiaonensis TaxID=650891 RepID=A0A1I6HAY1_9GAMM|nr:hypothetical protein [Marinobacter daqiaonensis]SFR51613.1 hypothetical protein SAMN05216203_1058 [Marinobacter daqiaonensis]